MLHRFSDIHRHVLGEASAGEVVVNLEPGQQPDSEGWYSAGIHPWQAAEAEQYWPWLEQVATNPRVVAIGEAGLDALRGPDLSIQQAVFGRQARLAEQVGKPLIIHVVRCWPQLIALHRRLNPAQPWIIHGFRGKPQLAQQLLDHGFSLSYGRHYNQASYDLTPPDRRYHETDLVRGE